MEFVALTLAHPAIVAGVGAIVAAAAGAYNAFAYCCRGNVDPDAEIIVENFLDEIDEDNNPYPEEGVRANPLELRWALQQDVDRMANDPPGGRRFRRARNGRHPISFVRHVVASIKLNRKLDTSVYSRANYMSVKQYVQEILEGHTRPRNIPGLDEALADMRTKTAADLVPLITALAFVPTEDEILAKHILATRVSQDQFERLNRRIVNSEGYSGPKMLDQ